MNSLFFVGHQPHSVDPGPVCTIKITDFYPAVFSSVYSRVNTADRWITENYVCIRLCLTDRYRKRTQIDPAASLVSIQPSGVFLFTKLHGVAIFIITQSVFFHINTAEAREISIGEIFDIAGGAAATPPRRKPEAGDRLILRLPGGKTATGVAAKVGEQPAMEISPKDDK